VENLAWNPDLAQGRPIFAGKAGDGRPMEVVVALDAADFVITVFGEVK